MQVSAIAAFAFAGATLFAPIVGAEEGGDKKLGERLDKERKNAERRDRDPKDKENAARDKARKDKEERAKNLAEFKEKTMTNKANIDELFAKAEESFKAKDFGRAGPFYESVVLATVPGSEEKVDISRERLIQLEDLAKESLKLADDFDLQKNYVKEAEELISLVTKFTTTKTREAALRRLVNLKSRPEVAGDIEYFEAEGLESEGKTMQSLTKYTSISNNPRYENSLAALKAKRKLDEMNQDAAIREKIQAELAANAEKEAPILLASAKNYLNNKMPKKAEEKLQTVIEKYPGTTFAKEAEQALAELK